MGVESVLTPQLSICVKWLKHSPDGVTQEDGERVQLPLIKRYIDTICGSSSAAERLVANENVEGSIPFSRSRFIRGCSLMAELDPSKV